MIKTTTFANLTPMELDIMMIFWQADTPITSRHIRDNYISGKTGLSIFRVINNLLDKSCIEIVSEIMISKKKTLLFAPAFTLADYQTYFFERFCKGSIKCFLDGVIKTNENRKEIISELKQWLSKCDEQS